jgi:methylenetetrahydrofolate reductase (NADPH)
MKISEILKRKMSFSFEVFPPKEDKPIEPLLETLRKLYRFKPDFISCTYGAGGTNKGRNEEICTAVKESGHEVMAHFTCIGSGREDARRAMGEYGRIGVENLLLLRGDFPEGQSGAGGDFAHADELLAFVGAEFPEFCAAAAAYPEKHMEAASFDEDLCCLRAKQDRGACFLMTQLCHDVRAYERFVRRARKAGVRIPIVAGLMPVLSRETILRITLSNGCSIPSELASIIGKYEKDAEGFKKAGKEYTVRQIHRYIAAGIDGLHIYTMNKYEDIADIVEASGIRQA